ncbi:hypothetical protein Pmani_020652 [Petrolisthes manimaculis]|uniref:Nephrin n=1 Tax=Petrolisthes manimaculis TaxID=1843537 RepID=A0AAE1PHX7_9EUCA|nr:hypothetical protein Pmani_020652 [Petrolisthes manimaculis]
MPESVVVAAGGDVFLSCIVESQQGKAQWTKDGFALGFERDVPGYPRFRYAGDPTLGEHHLVITSATLQEDGEYQCQVGPTDNTPPIWAAANVTVTVAPSSVKVVGWGDGEVVEVGTGTVLTLECLVGPARPPATVSWSHAGRPLPQERQMDVVEEGTQPRRWSVRSRLVVEATPADDDTTFTCFAHHPALPSTHHHTNNHLAEATTPLFDSVTFSVLHPPDPPVVMGYTSGDVLVAGERLSLTCTTLGGNPRPWVLWYRNGHLVDDTSITLHPEEMHQYHDRRLQHTREDANRSTRELQHLNEIKLNAERVRVSDGDIDQGRSTHIDSDRGGGRVSHLYLQDNPSDTRTVKEEVRKGNRPTHMALKETGKWPRDPKEREKWQKDSLKQKILLQQKNLNGRWDVGEKEQVQYNKQAEKWNQRTKETGDLRLENKAEVKKNHKALGTKLNQSETSRSQSNITKKGIWDHSDRIAEEDREGTTKKREREDLGIGRRGVVNEHEMVVTEIEDGAHYRCEVTSDLLTAPLNYNLTLNVYYAPSSVSIRGPSAVKAGEVLNMTCETSRSNPPASITWIVQGKVMEKGKSVVGRDGSGGWVTSSFLSLSGVGAVDEIREVHVECRSLNPAVEKVIRKAITVTIIRPAGRPIFQTDLRDPVVAGTLLDLSCVSVGGHPPPTIRVLKEGKELAGEVDVEGGVAKARVEVEMTAADNGREVMCEVTSAATKVPLSISTSLSVLFPPWEVYSGAKPSTVEEGGAVVLTCHTTSSNPPATITWSSASALLLSPAPTVTQEHSAFGGTVTRSEVELVVQADDNGRVFECEASNGLGVALNSAVSLSVLHAPVWVVKPPEDINVQEGSELIITATARANPGPLRYWWRRGEETLEGVEGELVLGKLLRNQAGQYSVNAYNPRGAVNASFLLNVQYGPEELQSAERVTVGEGGAATIECTATGNPTPHLTWTKDGHNSIFLITSILSSAGSTTETLFSGVGIARLVIGEASPSHTSLYLCHASNVVSSLPPVSTKLIVTQPPRVASEAAGAGGSWAGVGGSGRLVCRVRAAPAPSFTWTTHTGLTLQSGPKYTVHDPQLVDGLVLWASVLEVGNVEKEDYMRYTCTAHNPLGSDSASLALNPPSRPHAPTNLTAINVTSSSVSLMWTPNFSGGLPRSYTLRYRPTSTLTHQTVDISGGNTAGTTLSGLLPATQYLFSLQASNNEGSSPWLSPPLMVTLPDMPSSSSSSSEGSSRWRLPRLILLIMTLTGVALLFLNIAIIACFVRRRTNSRQASSSSTKKSERSGSNFLSTSPSLNHRRHSCEDESLFSLTSSTIPTSGTKDESNGRAEESERTGEDSPKSRSGDRERRTGLSNGYVTSSFKNGSVKNEKEKKQEQEREKESDRGKAGFSHRPPLTSSFSQPLPPVIYNNPEVCSLTSSTYDHLPGSPHQHQPPTPTSLCQEPQTPTSLHQEPQTPPSDLHYRQERQCSQQEDQISIASYQSNHSRTYSQGYTRPAPPPGCPHYARQEGGRGLSYTSLDPTSLYSLSAEYYQARCGQSQYSGGTPLGYATLGPRSRRSAPPSHVRTSSASTLHRHHPPHPPPRQICPPDCCYNECTSYHNNQNHQRRSSFHGTSRRDQSRSDAGVNYNGDFGMAQPVERGGCGRVRQNDTGGYYRGQQESDTGYGRTQKNGLMVGNFNRSQQITDVGTTPCYSRFQIENHASQNITRTDKESSALYSNKPQQDNTGRNYSRGPQASLASTGTSDKCQQEYNRGKNGNHRYQNSDLPPPPSPSASTIVPVSTTMPSTSQNRNTPTTTTGRPKFPHDYVRQGSTRKARTERNRRNGEEENK